MSQKSPQAPGQALGFYLQQTRLLAHLLEATDGTIISLEKLDDVASEKNGISTVEQVKSSTSKRNPISNRAIDLWKTLSNWVDAVKNKSLAIQSTKFVIYSSRAFKGNLCEAFSAAKTTKEVGEALKLAKNELWGIAPKYSKKAKLGAELSGYVENFFNNSDIAIKIIENFSLECGTGSSIEDLKISISNKFVANEIEDKVVTYLLGWVKTQLDSLIEKNLPACILYDDFKKVAIAYIRIIDRRNVIQGVAENPPREAIEGHLRTKVYVRQLEIIDCKEEEKISAITDYMKASIDRVYWAQAGLIHQTSFDELEKDLIRTWDNKKRSCDILHADKKDEDKGKLLYYDCGQHKSQLEGLAVPEYFCPGSFHALSDKKKIGWHKEYTTLL